LWLLQFAVSAFSERQYLAPSSGIITFIAGYSTAGAAAVVAALIALFFKSLNNKYLDRLFWLMLTLDCLASALIAISQDSRVQYGYARYAIAGEERTVYRALFWLPLFSAFKISPSYNALMWTEKIFSKIVISAIGSASLGFVVQFPRPEKTSLRENWKMLTLVGLFAACLIFAGFKAYPRAEDAPEQDWISELFEKEYRVMPNSEDTRAALVMIETGNYAQALESLHSASSSGDSSASVVLAELYLGGDIVEQDNAMARLIFLRGARAGNLKALAGFARLFWGKEREKLLEFAADAGDRSVYNMQLLGLYYMQGIVMKCDYRKSAYYYRIAAEEGSAEGAWQTAGFLFRGYMTEPDLDEAAYWADRAKQSADPQSLYHRQANILLGRIKRAPVKKSHLPTAAERQ
jgi:TPR repeat protein